MHRLDKVRLKLDRAKIHLAALDMELREFFKTEPYRIETSPPPPPPKPLKPPVDPVVFTFQPVPLPLPRFGTFRILRDPPPILSLIIGDYVHNLRSALDHLVWQLSLSTTLTPTPRSQFPIFDKPNPGIKGRIKDWTNDVPDKARDVIEDMQPYNRLGFAAGHHRFYRLWQIDKLDGIDKHAALIVTILSESVVSEEPDGSRIVTMFSNPLKDGDPVFWDTVFSKSIRPMSKDQPHIYVEPTYGVVLEESPLLTIPLSELIELHDFVDRDVLPRFARFLK